MTEILQEHDDPTPAPRIECSYPFSDNSHLTEVANDLIPEALAAAQTALTHMLERLK